MAEGFEPYHVPQQSRRDKLRVLSLQQQQSSQPGCAVGLVPIFDHHPSLISSDLIACVDIHNQDTAANRSCNNKQTSSSNPITVCNSKGGGHVNLMGYVGGGGGLLTASSSSSSSPPSATNRLYMDPHSSSTIQLNPISIQDHIISNNNDHFIFNSTHHEQGLRFLDQSFHGGDVVVYRPEPLSSVAHEQQQQPSNVNNINATRGGGQGLSLSLSSSNHSSQQGAGSHQLPLELNLQQRYDSSSSMYSTKVNNGGCFLLPPPPPPPLPPPPGDASASINELLLSRNDVVVPLGPFIGYASILKGSRFLRPAQQLLDELSDVGRGFYSDKIAPDHSVLLDPSLESFCATGIVDDSKTCSDAGENRRRKKSRLMSMLDEVYKRYKQYYQQMQAVVASFESVSGVRNAAPFANLALKSMSKHFKYLKNAITDQLQFITESRDHHVTREKDTAPVGFENRPGGMEIESRRRIQNVGFVDNHRHQPVWRPQRGLPERAVTVLRAWLFEHFLHPYPTDTDKLMLAKQTGLSRNQVSNWFINARVRLWKPMVEEIHMLETRQGQKAPQKEELNNAVSDTGNTVPPSGKKLGVTPSSNQRIEEFPSKRTRNDLPASATTGFPAGNEQSVNLPYDHHHDNSSRHPCFSSGGGGTGGVSLTLGLHQNNGIGLPDPFPINAARRFGLDSNSDGYVNMSGINEAQNQHFRREIIGGQLLHDFVG